MTYEHKIEVVLYWSEIEHLVTFANDHPGFIAIENTGEIGNKHYFFIKYNNPVWLFKCGLFIGKSY